MLSFAFLRAINIGGRRVRMGDLRSAFDDAGLGPVQTYIATGNVVFDGPEPSRARVEAAIEAAFGFSSEAFIRGEADLRAIVDANPWRDPDALVEISFLEREPDRSDAASLEGTIADPEDLRVIGREVFFLREGKGIPTVHKESTTERMLGMRTTRRGMATVEGMVARYLG